MSSLIEALKLACACAVVAASAAVPSAAAVDPTVLEPELRERIARAGPVDVIARWRDDAEADDALRPFAAAIGVRLETIPAATLTIPGEQVAVLARTVGVERIELADRIPTLLRTATTATRVRAVWDAQDGGPLSVDGRTIDGAGIGVAVVDSGISGTHPDLADRVARNFKVASDRLVAGVLKRVPVYTGPNDVLVEAVETDTTSGHGTHVAGIVAGTGAASGGGAKGAAPGAKVYGFSVGEGLNIVEQHALAAFDWIALHGAQQDPPIRVVNNSWGSGGMYDDSRTLSKLTTAMVDAGITVVWAAGNGDLTGDGGDCTGDLTMSQAKHPGVISVAAYSDGDTGARDGSITGFSSRGREDDPATWPDISAPGARIYSALAPTGGASWLFKSVDLLLAAFDEPDPDNDAFSPYYVNFDGTSMAAPHVAGIAALVRQANPALTPPQVEDLLEDTAYAYASGKPYTADPANPTTSSSCDKGHGLIDARAAVEAALALR